MRCKSPTWLSGSNHRSPTQVEYSLPRINPFRLVRSYLKMAFPYKHVLLVGATSGIGRAMADRLIQAGIKVTAVGWRKQRLEEFVEKYGEEKASAMNYDVSDINGAPQFAAESVGEHFEIWILGNIGVSNLKLKTAQPVNIQTSTVSSSIRAPNGNTIWPTPMMGTWVIQSRNGCQCHQLRCSDSGIHSILVVQVDPNKLYIVSTRSPEPSCW